MASPVSLVDIRPIDQEEILMTWEDGHRSLFTNKFLRFECPCAQCVDERTGRRIIHSEQISNKIQISKSEPVGRYGIRIFFSDGHQTGIFSFDYLRSLCSCQLCKPAIA